MAVPVGKKGFRAKFAQSTADILAAQALRQRVFFSGEPSTSHDQDHFDEICQHVLIEDIETEELVCCFRFFEFETGCLIHDGYSAQFYDLSELSRFDGPLVEMGRFCVDPKWGGTSIVRTAWAAMTKYVDDNGIEMLFGCSSFSGINPLPYKDAFAVLKHKYLAPSHRKIGKGTGEVFDFEQEIKTKPDLRKGMAAIPPLLRSYLAMGGWVSDHAVIDRQMNTIHVFTGLEISAIPPERKKRLRALAE